MEPDDARRGARVDSYVELDGGGLARRQHAGIRDRQRRRQVGAADGQAGSQWEHAAGDRAHERVVGDHGSLEDRKSVV